MQLPAILPAPQKMIALEHEGMEMPSRITVSLPSDLPGAAEHMQVFAQALRVGYGQSVVLAQKDPSAEVSMHILLDTQLGAEAYRLTLGDEIVIEVRDNKGLCHATASLLQLWCNIGERLPAVLISDAPANSYRSLMVDLGRNPHSLTLMKETIDLLWFYKVDSLHLHLTDDQRFAFPSTKFPNLASEDAWSLADFHALENYAVQRGVTLIPELEAPGHSRLLRHHYPEVFGTTATELASLPSARDGLKTILGEMMEVFQSSPYIHVGGDEAYGVPHELQQDLVNDLQDYLSEHGRTAMVWEGPALGEGEHKINTEVIHINWRTIDFPASAMLDAGYPVVNAAWDPLYVVDHYPRNNFTMAAPEHIYRNLNRTRFGHFNPDMPTFSDPVVVEPQEGVLGYCMPWWEGREEYFMPLIPSRLIAMAAIAWSEPAERDVEWFTQQAQMTESQRHRCFYPVWMEAPLPQSPNHLVFSGSANLSLTAQVVELGNSAQAHLRFTLDGSEPTASSTSFVESFAVDASTQLRAALFLDDKPVGHGSRWMLQQVDPTPNLALHKPVATSVPSGPFFNAERLTDGGTGNLDYFLGYPAMPAPILMDVDLQTKVHVQKIVVHTYQHGDSYESLEIALSTDGEHWTTTASRREKPEGQSSPAVFNFSPQPAQFVRIRSFGHKGQVFDSFSRVTEIQVY